MNMQYNLKVKELIDSNIAVATDAGANVYIKLEKQLMKSDIVSLDFEGISILTTAFLNAAVGQLYSTDKFSSDFLNAHLKLINVQEDDKPLFSMVIKRAKEYFQNKEAFENTVNEHLSDY